MIFLDERATGRDNNFNALRMIAASAVLVSHAWPLALGASAHEPLEDLTGYKLGTTAVIIFFAISGFFVTRSAAERDSAAGYVLARALRILPALIVATVLSVVVLGAWMTDLSQHAYWSSRLTWFYVPKNVLMAFGQQWALPGVFTNNPMDAVNGSLWTLPSEVLCYILALAVTPLLGRRTYVVPLGAAIVLTLLYTQGEAGSFLNRMSILGLPFALGAAAYVYRASLPLSIWVLAGAAVLAWMGHATPLYPALHALAWSYGALYFGFAARPLLAWYPRKSDLSYGMYIYAFPVQQIIVSYAQPIGPWMLIALSVGPVLALSAASWWLVEKPALRAKTRLTALMDRNAQPV